MVSSQICTFFYSNWPGSESKVWDLLYILTRVWVLRKPKAGPNLHFQGRDENISPNRRRQRQRLTSEVDRRPWPEFFYWSTSTSKKAQWSTSTKSDWDFLRPVENISGRQSTVDVSGLTFSSLPYSVFICAKKLKKCKKVKNLRQNFAKKKFFFNFAPKLSVALNFYYFDC